MAKHYLTSIILNWLRETYPQYTHAFGYYNPPFIDDVTIWSYNIITVYENKLQIGKKFYYAGDPKFFIKLKPRITRAINKLTAARACRCANCRDFLDP